jgi:hypothetical protein
MAESEATSAQGVAAAESASVDEDEIQQLDARAQEATIQLTGVTYRHYWGAKNGQWKLDLNWGGLSAANQVYVGWRARARSFTSGIFANSPNDRACCARPASERAVSLLERPFRLTSRGFIAVCFGCKLASGWWSEKGKYIL